MSPFIVYTGLCEILYLPAKICVSSSNAHKRKPQWVHRLLTTQALTLLCFLVVARGRLFDIATEPTASSRQSTCCTAAADNSERDRRRRITYFIRLQMLAMMSINRITPIFICIIMRPHYRSCASVSLSVCFVQVPNSKTRKHSKTKVGAKD